MRPRDELVEDAAAPRGRSRAPERSCISTSGSKMRITTFSPKATGSVETRSSTSLPPRMVLMRPSCGAPLLGDVEPRHRLDARDDRRCGRSWAWSGCRAARRRCGSGSATPSRLGSMWMSLARVVEGVLEHELDRVDDVLVARLDLGLVLHAHELLEIAEVDAGREVLLGALDRVAEAVELGDRAQDRRARTRPRARSRDRRCGGRSRSPRCRRGWRRRPAACRPPW